MKKLFVYALMLSCIAVAGEPTIIEVVRSGNIAKLRELVSTRNGLHARGSQNQTALHEAAAKCDMPAAELLIGAGVDRLIRDDGNRTAASIATKCPKSAATNELVRLLVSPPKTAVALNETAPWSLQDAAARGKADVVKMLLQLGADVNAAGTNGSRALEIACRKGNAQVTKILLDHGADVRLKTNAGTTVLHEAALGDSSEVIEMLLGLKADIDAIDTESGSTPLHFAASFGRLNAVKTLVRYGADVNRKDGKGITALETAVANRQEDVVRVLRVAK